MTKLRLRLFSVVCLLSSLSAAFAADLTITAANVLASGDKGSEVTSGVIATATTITAGQAVYYDGTSNAYKLADADSATAHGVSGIALNGGSAGQPIQVCKADPRFKVGATLVIGDTVWLSVTPGGLTKVAAEGVATASWVSVMGVAVSTTEMNFKIISAGAVKP